MNGLRQVQEDSFSEALFVYSIRKPLAPKKQKTNKKKPISFLSFFFFLIPHTVCLVVPLKLYKVIKLETVGRKMSLNADPASNGSQGHRYNALCACQQ